MSQVNDLIHEIQFLQKQTNDALVKKQTATMKKQSIQKDIEQLKKKSIEQFGCDIDELQQKRQQYSNEIKEKIANLKKILGIE